MQTVDVSQLSRDVPSVIAAAQREDVFVVEHGKVVAIVTKPRPGPDERYWRERERMLADIVADPEWDSTEAISQDRDRP
jgi:hypothetical protein